jgi:hypothetical protein
MAAEPIPMKASLPIRTFAAIAAPGGDVGPFAHVAIMIDRCAGVDDGSIS